MNSRWLCLETTTNSVTRFSVLMTSVGLTTPAKSLTARVPVALRFKALTWPLTWLNSLTLICGPPQTAFSLDNGACTCRVDAGGARPPKAQLARTHSALG